MSVSCELHELNYNILLELECHGHSLGHTVQQVHGNPDEFIEWWTLTTGVLVAKSGHFGNFTKLGQGIK